MICNPAPCGSTCVTPSSVTVLEAMPDPLSVADGVTAYAVDAGPGRSPAQVADSVTAALGQSGLSTEAMGLEGNGAMGVAWAQGDFLRLGHEWTVARMPSAQSGRQEVVLVTEGASTHPVMFMQGLSTARPATVLAPAVG